MVACFDDTLSLLVELAAGCRLRCRPCICKVARIRQGFYLRGLVARPIQVYYVVAHRRRDPIRPSLHAIKSLFGEVVAAVKVRHAVMSMAHDAVPNQAGDSHLLAMRGEGMPVVVGRVVRDLRPFTR